MSAKSDVSIGANAMSRPGHGPGWRMVGERWPRRAARALLAFAVVLGLAGSGASAFAARVALVIGNGAFMRASDLANPTNDAYDLARRLDELGFDVFGGGAQLNQTRAQMIDLIGEFAGSLESGDLAIVFFAGHGVQYRGENFLIPVDDKGVQYADDLPANAYSATALLQQLSSRRNVTNVIILDACRNFALPERPAANAPAAAPERGGKFIVMGDDRAATPPGLTEMEAPKTAFNLVMFAAASGSTASDGEGRNSPFTAALLRALQRPQRTLQEIAREVRRTVREQTGGAQAPETRSSLEEAVFLVPPAQDQPDIERDAEWRAQAFAVFAALTLDDPQARLAALREVVSQRPSGASYAVLRDLIAVLERRME